MSQTQKAYGADGGIAVVFELTKDGRVKIILLRALLFNLYLKRHVSIVHRT